MSDAPDEASERAAIEEVTQRLIVKYPTNNPAYIHELVEREYARMLTATLRDYIPVLVEHAVKQELHRENEKRDANLI